MYSSSSQLRSQRASQRRRTQSLGKPCSHSILLGVSSCAVIEGMCCLCYPPVACCPGRHIRFLNADRSGLDESLSQTQKDRTNRLSKWRDIQWMTNNYQSHLGNSHNLQVCVATLCPIGLTLVPFNLIGRGQRPTAHFGFNSSKTDKYR